MPSPAQVRSTDAIEAFRLALVKFQDHIQNALDAMEVDLRRTTDWIEHDRPAHWRTEVREAEDGVHEAKQDLERCLLMTTVEGQRPACREQKAAVAKAKAHLDYCREKVDLVKKWQRNFGHEALEFHGRIGQLRRIVEMDMPRAQGVLEQITRRLEEYQLEKPPEATSPLAPPTAPVEAATRAVEPSRPATSPGV